MEDKPPAAPMDAKRPAAWWVRVLRTLGMAVAAYFLMGVFLAVFLEDSFIYYPSKGDVGPSPGEEVHLTTADGVKIHGWYAETPGARTTLLWFHGNAGSMEDRRGLFRGFRLLPANVLLIDYRGYGMSEGSPSEQGLYHDARAAYDWLAEKTEPERIVLFGKSLGGAPACELATQVEVGGLICESTFTSAGDMASRILPFFPARLFLKHRFDNLKKVREIRCPKLFVHSRKDEVIPFEMSERLFEAAAEPKDQAWFDLAGHNDMDFKHGDEYYDRLKRFLDGVAERAESK